MSERNADIHARIVFLVVTLICAGVLAYAYYLQTVLFLDPCPWCIAQRLLFMTISLIAVTGLFHGPDAGGARAYGVAGAVVSLCGVAAASYQIWLQSDPARAASCTASWLEYTLDWLRIGQLSPNFLMYDGPCTLAPWDLFGFSIPEWSLICFALLGFDFLSLIWRRSKT